MLSINISELIWTIINFFLLFFVLKRFLFGPLLSFMDARQAKIDAGTEAQREAQARLDENAQDLARRKPLPETPNAPPRPMRKPKRTRRPCGRRARNA